MRWTKNHIKPRDCFYCNSPLSLQQLYRKNRFCSSICSEKDKTLPDREGRAKAHNLKYRLKNREELAKKRNELLCKRRGVIYDLLGHLCNRCGFTDKRALQIDHIYGFGKKSMRRCSNSMQYYLEVQKSVINNEGKYQILCANCNWIKRHENKENGWDYTTGAHDNHIKEKYGAQVVN